MRHAIEEILEKFDPTASDVSARPKMETMIGVKLCPRDKARYDKLQHASRRRFSKVLREIIVAAICAAERKLG